MDDTVKARLEASPALLLVAALAAFALQVAGFHDLRHDDAYITYRYGQNLALGEGLVFNPGERLMGSTSPGHALLSAAVYALTSEEALPTVMACLGCLGWTLQAIALFLLLRGALGTWRAFALAAVVAVGAAGSGSWVALETNLVVALGLWATLAAVRRSWMAAAALAALSALMRPDALLLGALLAGWALFDLRGRAWRPALVFVGLLAPWVSFATAYFGSPIPQSATRKFHAASFSEYLSHTATHTTQALFAGVEASTLSIGLAWLLAVGGAALMVRRDRRLWVVPAWGALHALAYLVLRPFTAHTWHLYPLVLAFIVCVWGGLLAVLASAPRRWLVVSVLLLCGWLFFGAARATVSYAQSHATAYWNGARDATYREIARYLVEQAGPEDLVSAVEVGTIGYYAHVRMFDLGGLISRGPHPRVPAGAAEWLVVDRLYLNFAPKGLRPVVAVTNLGFPVYVFRIPARAPAP